MVAQTLTRRGRRSSRRSSRNELNVSGGERLSRIEQHAGMTSTGPQNAVEVSITRRGVLIPKARIPPQIEALVRRELHVAPVSLNDPFPKKFRVFLESPSVYVVPLHWARKALEPWNVRFRDLRPPAQRLSHLSFNGTLRPELRQPEGVAAVMESWKTNGGGAMLCFPVGFGKTVAALYLIAQLKLKTLVLVHKQFLAEQWQERVTQCLPGATTSFIQGATCDTSGDVVIAMIQTLLSRQHDAKLFDGFGLVVADETHHLGAAAFSQCMFTQCAPYTLGLSATPTRKDGLTKVVEWFVGPVAFHIRRENQDTTTVRVVKFSSPEFDQPPPVNRRGDICFASVISRLVENEQRTKRIAGEISRLEGRDVLVLTHRRQHVADIAAALRGMGIEDCGTYVGGDKQCPDTRVVIATYALTSEGFDLPRLNALVLATPASDVEQACGRVMRGSATRGAVIVDVVDQWGVCFSQFAKRRAYYRRTGFCMPQTDDPKPPPTEAPPAAFAFLDD